MKKFKTVKAFLKEYKSIQGKYHALSKEAEKLHEYNKELASKMMPLLKEKIKTQLFDKELCFSGSWRHISEAPGQGGHFELVSLGSVNKFRGFDSPYPIHELRQLDIAYIETAILDRYFEYYEPNYETLNKELGIIIDKIELDF